MGQAQSSTATAGSTEETRHEILREVIDRNLSLGISNALDRAAFLHRSRFNDDPDYPFYLRGLLQYVLSQVEMDSNNARQFFIGSSNMTTDQRIECMLTEIKNISGFGSRALPSNEERDATVRKFVLETALGYVTAAESSTEVADRETIRTRTLTTCAITHRILHDGNLPEDIAQCHVRFVDEILTAVDDINDTEVPYLTRLRRYIESQLQA